MMERKKRKPIARERRNSEGSSTLRKRSNLLQGVKTIDQNDVDFLRKFMTEHGKITPARLTGASSKQQRKIKRLIRRHRTMGYVL